MAQFVGAAMLAGSVISAIGATQQASATATADLYNANLNQANATVAMDQANQEAARFERSANKQLGTQRANFGATGDVTDALSVLADSESQIQLDSATIKYNGEMKRLGYQMQAGLDRMGAKTAETQGIYNTASQFLTGAGGAVMYGSSGGAGLNRGALGSMVPALG